MTMKTLLAALALILAPGLAVAQGCSDRQAIQDASMSCAVGSIYDAKTNACVPGTNS